MDNAFRNQFRAEMDEFRKELQKDKLEGNGCDARTQTGIRRERRNTVFHDKRMDYHREADDEYLDENRGIGQESKREGN